MKRSIKRLPKRTQEELAVLREVTIRECAARIAYYDEMIEKEEKNKI